MAAGWLLTLAALAWTTANPVTLNRIQLLSSHDVVVANVEDRSESGVARLRIERSLTGRNLPQTIQLAHAPPVLTPGERFLVPLRRNQSGFEITPAPAAADDTSLVYPADDAVVDHAAFLLRERPAVPYP